MGRIGRVAFKHIQQIASGKLLSNRELNPVLSDNLEGWDGCGVGGRLKREGTYIYLWLIHDVVRQKPTQRCKANTLQFDIWKN